MCRLHAQAGSQSVVKPVAMLHSFETILSLSQRQTSLCMVQVVGDKRCPIVDTWWQTETGGHMITPLPAAWPEKPGSATLPFFGVVPAIVNEKGEAR